jgi:hypothetical protein
MLKKLGLAILATLFAAGMAMAQNSGTFPTPPAPGSLPTGLSSNSLNGALGQDVLGAHNGYGRGCVMCHAPHGGAAGNGSNMGTGAGQSNDPNNGATALWGENLAPFYGQSAKFAGGNTVTLPSSALDTSQGSGATTVLLCLSCHDGVATKPAMMKGTTVEMLPIAGGSAPTLFGLTQGNSSLNYINEHPVGPTADVGCGTASHNWDCTGGGSGTTTITITSSMAMYTFATVNYKGSFWYNYATTGKSYPLTSYTGQSNAVTCTTCHNQHSMTVYSNNSGSYPTMFFIKGEYMPSTGGNSVAQFCRNCHGGESNEVSGLMNVKTY